MVCGADHTYLAKHNQRFSVPPKNSTDVHREVGKTKAELDAIFSFQEERVLCNDYTIHWKTRLFQIKEHQPYFLLPRTKVTVEEWLNGKIKIRHKGKYLKMHEIDPQKIRKPSTATKLLPVKPPVVKKLTVPAANHPWRNYPYGKQQYSSGKTTYRRELVPA